MTYQHSVGACVLTPTLCRESTTFLMKAHYQRIMLYGMDVASALVHVDLISLVVNRNLVAI